MKQISANQKEQILFYLIAAYFVTLFFGKLTSINVVLTAFLFIYSFFFNSFSEKWQLLKSRKHVLGMILFFLFLLLSFLLSENWAMGLHHLKIRLPLLLFPISIGLLYLRKEFKEKILLTFAGITTIISFVCLINSVVLYFKNHQSDIFYNDNFTLILKQQSIYVALLVNFAIYILGYFLLFKQHTKKPLMALSLLFLFGVSYLLASRINLVVLALASLTVGIYYLISRRKILESIALVFGLLLAVFAISKFQPKSFNRFKELSFTQFDYENMGPDSHFNMEVNADQWNGANFRLAAWNCGWEVFKENMVSGTGIGDKDDALMAKYQEKNFRFAIMNNRNVHNNYLDILFSTGLIGFIVFFLGWVVLPLAKALNYRDGLTMLMLLTLFIAWVTEVYFSRNFGTMIASFFIPFLLTDKK